MLRRNDISLLLLVSLFSIQAFASPQAARSIAYLINTQNAIQLVDVDEGTALARHSVEMKFFASHAIPASEIKTHLLDCQNSKTEGNGIPVHALTDDDGNFVLTGVPAGRYFLRVETEGFPVFSGCLVARDAGKAQPCKNYFYFRVSKKLPFFTGDILEGGCRQWVPDPCATLFMRDDRPLVSKRIKITYIDGSDAAHVSISLLGYARKEMRVHAKNPQPNYKIGSVQSDDHGVADLTPLLAQQHPGLKGLRIGNLKGVPATAGLSRISLTSSPALTTLVLFQSGCHAKQFWNIEVVQP